MSGGQRSIASFFGGGGAKPAAPAKPDEAENVPPATKKPRLQKKSDIAAEGAAREAALAQREGAPPILLLDEVAAHLDAARRAALYDEICALGTQAWMTGTGPELFAELGARAQILEVSDSGGASEVIHR